MIKIWQTSVFVARLRLVSEHSQHLCLCLLSQLLPALGTCQSFVGHPFKPQKSRKIRLSLNIYRVTIQFNK